MTGNTRLGLAFLIPLTSSLLQACSGVPTERTGSSAASAFTAERGDEFVVSATPTRIVLKKQVDDITLPFDVETLKGHAILVHPIADVTDTGVYSRAVDVREEDDTFVIDAKPLTFDEMENIGSDEVDRLYVASGKTPVLQIESTNPFATGIHPLSGGAEGAAASSGGTSFSGLAFTGMNLGTGWDFGSPVFLRPGVSFTFAVQKSDVEARPLIAYSKEEGLEVGFKGSLDFQSTLTITGKVSGEFMRSPTLEGPPILTFLPIAGIPVPVKIQGKAFVSCSATLDGIANVNATISAKAEISGSMRARIDKNVAPSKWFSEGRYPSKLSGSAGVHLGVNSTPGVSAMCMIPRLEVHADFVGIAGPYLAMMPTIAATKDGATFDTKLAMGVGSGWASVGPAVEFVVYTWKP